MLTQGFKRILPVPLFLLLTLLLPLSVQAAPYGCSNYGEGEYNEDGSCTDETGGSGGTEADDETSDGDSDSQDEEEPAGDIVLDDFPEYLDGTGKQLELEEDEKVYFDVDDETYSVTVSEVGDDYVVLTISPGGQEVTVNVGETLEIDVDGDGVADIEAYVLGISDGVASIVFTKLTAQGEEVLVPATTEEDDGGSLLPLWASLSLIGLALAWLIALFIRRRNRKNEPPVPPTQFTPGSSPNPPTSSPPTYNGN